MWTQHNQGVLLVPLLWYQKVVKKSPILPLSLYLGLFFISIHQQCMLFRIGNEHTFINIMEWENQVGSWSRSCLWLYHAKKLSYKHPEPPKLSLYTFKPVWIATFKTPWGKLKNLLGMKLTTDIILLSLPSVNNGIFVYFWSCRCGLWNQLNQWILALFMG